MSQALADRLDRWAPTLAIFVAVAVALYLAAAWASGAAATWASAQRLGLPLFAGGTVVAVATFGLRFLRWRLLMTRLGHRIATGVHLRIYIGGLALSSTPGKLGETLRSALLHRLGVPWRDSLAAFFGDRLSDVIGMALAGALAAWMVADRSSVLEALFVAALLGAWLLARLASGALPRWAAARRWTRAAAAPLRCWAAVWTAATWPWCVAAALLAYGVQGLVFAAYVDAVAAPLPPARCVLIFASATLLGAASGVPGGLGVMEAALVWQLRQAGVDAADALAVTLLFRASTLWTALLLGSACLASLAGAAKAAAAQSARGG